MMNLGDYATVTPVDEGGTSLSNPTGSWTDLPAGTSSSGSSSTLTVLFCVLGGLFAFFYLKGVD